MKDNEAILFGELDPWPPKDDLAAVLSKGGLRVQSGRYSLRLEDCHHFLIQRMGDDLASPQIEATAPSADELARDARRVSEALAAAQIKHRFEIYGPNEMLEAYIHFRWPNRVQHANGADGQQAR